MLKRGFVIAAAIWVLRFHVSFVRPLLLLAMACDGTLGLGEEVAAALHAAFLAGGNSEPAASESQHETAAQGSEPGSSTGRERFSSSLVAPDVGRLRDNAPAAPSPAGAGRLVMDCQTSQLVSRPTMTTPPLPPLRQTLSLRTISPGTRGPPRHGHERSSPSPMVRYAIPSAPGLQCPWPPNELVTKARLQDSCQS